ncbi:MAG: hypothetical protein ACK5U6_17445 [Pseudanabaena sp.]|jgi:CHASE3 domain sensor protein
MSRPHLRRHYELLSFLLNAVLPIFIVVVLFQQHIEMSHQTQQIEDLRAELATIRLNTNVQSNHGSVNPTNTANTSK